MKNFVSKYYAFLISVFVFIIYLITTSPSVTEFDSGELATVQATLGIAHPPGYPLFTIIGYIFLFIPLPVSTIYQLHILSGVWSALSVFIFILTIKLILDNTNKFKSPGENDLQTGIFSINSFDEKTKHYASIFSGLIFAFSNIVWSQSTSVEVYSLEIFIGLLVIYFSLSAFIDEKKPHSISKYWIITVVTLGLGFSNHMMTLYLLPAVIYLYFTKNRFNYKSISFLFVCLLIIIAISFLFYSYLLIRSNQNPVMNWGNPADIKSAYEHVTAKYYSQFFFAGWGTIKKQITYFIASLGFLPGNRNLWNSEFNINIIFVFTGFAISILMMRKFFVFFALIFIATLLFTVNYSIPDIYTYYSFAYLALAFFSVPSILFLSKLLQQKTTKIIFILVIPAMILIQAALSYGAVNRSDYYIIDDYNKALLKFVNKNAVVFTNQWDYFLSPSLYLREVENYRKDVKIIHKDLLPVDWYMRKEKKEGLIFFNDKTQNVNIKKYTEGKEFYLSPEILRDEVNTGNFKLDEKRFVIPDVLLFRAVNSKKYYPAADPDFKIRFPESNTFAVQKIKNIIFIMLQNRIKYELQYGRRDRAKIYLNKIIELFPNEEIPLELLVN